MVARRIENLDSEEEVVKDESPITFKTPTRIQKVKIATVSHDEFKNQDYPKNVNFKIKVPAKRLSESKAIQRQYIKEKIRQFVKNNEAIQQMETRRNKYLQEILSYISENLTGIYRLDN